MWQETNDSEVFEYSQGGIRAAISWSPREQLWQWTLHRKGGYTIASGFTDAKDRGYVLATDVTVALDLYKNHCAAMVVERIQNLVTIARENSIQLQELNMKFKNFFELTQNELLVEETKNVLKQFQ